MKRLSRDLFLAALLGVALLAGGCASVSAPSSSLFVLDDGPQPGSGAPDPAQPSLMIAPVALANYLAHGGIVYQTAAHRIVVANNNRWASSLSGQLSDTLYNVLSHRLRQINVQRATGDQAGLYRLTTRVDRFYGSFDGAAHIAGQWQLESPDGQVLRRENFDREIPLDENGYPALVASLSSGWQAVAADMAPPLASVLGDANGRGKVSANP